jgi:hypothetical protein
MSFDDPFGRLERLGIESVAHRIDVDAFWRDLSEIGERRQELRDSTDVATHRVQELVEQFVALELLDIHAQDVVVNMAFDDSPMASLLARRANATCYREASGALGVGNGTPATSIRLPDDYADKLVVQGPLDDVSAEPDRKLLIEVARVLRPGGSAAAFMPVDAAATLERGVLEAAATAGLTVTVHLFVNLTDVYPRAEPLLALVLRKQTAFEVRSAREENMFASTPQANVSVAGPTAWQTLLPQGVVVVTALAVALMTFADLDVPLLRPTFALLFLLTCPGLLLAHALRLPDRLAEVTLGVALSIAFNTIVVSALLLAGTSSTQTILTVLLLLTFAALVIDLTFGGRVGAAKAP